MAKGRRGVILTGEFPVGDYVLNWRMLRGEVRCVTVHPIRVSVMNELNELTELSTLTT